jgi:hypothetical protein
LLLTALEALKACDRYDSEPTVTDPGACKDKTVLHICSGDVFDEVFGRARPLPVMGPAALLHCIASNETPSLASPVVSFALKGLAVCTSSFASKEKDQLHRKIELMVRCCPYHGWLTHIALRSCKQFLCSGVGSRIVLLTTILFFRSGQGGIVSKALTSVVTHVVAKKWDSEKSRVSAMLSPGMLCGCHITHQPIGQEPTAWTADQICIVYAGSVAMACH